MVSNKKSTHTDSSLLISTDTLFVDWAVSNIGTGATEQRYSVKLLLDDKEVTSWFIEPPHTPNFYSFVEDLELHSLSAGTHILTLIADSTSEIAESNETDNVFTKKIRVDVSPEGEQEITIVFPKVQKDAAFDTGVAIANPTASVAEVNLLLIDEKGNLITGPEITNPVSLSIPANNQVARTVQEFFGKEVREGWVLASSRNLVIVGFFLSFSDDVSKIDGAEAVVFEGSSTVVFPEIFSGPDQFTEISVISSGPITFELYGTEGILIEEKTVQLPEDRAGLFKGS